jgi:hypothetical protein
MAHLLPAGVLNHLPLATRAHLLSRSFFPGLIAPPFMDGLRLAFYVSAGMSFIAAVASMLRGKQFFHEVGTPAAPVAPPFGANTGELPEDLPRTGTSS